MPFGRTFAASLAGLTTFALVGCGGASAPVTPQAAVVQAAEKTADAGSSRASFEITMTGLGPEPFTMTGEGIFDSSERKGRMTMDLSALAEGSGQELGEAEMIFDEFVVYMKFPFLQELQPQLKPWLKFDIRELGKEQGFDLGQLSQLNQNDPSQALQYLRAASNDVKEVGKEDVRGVETTHYRMTIDLKKVVDQAPEDQREQLRASIDQIVELSGIQMVPTEVWVDEDGLARRMKLTYEGMRFAPGQQGDMTMTMELYDFGVEVDVEPPPESEVTDIQELIQQGAGS
jgi:predicted transcriptional regulator